MELLPLLLAAVLGSAAAADPQTWSKVKFEPCKDGDATQQWKFEHDPSENKPTQIVNEADGRCLQTDECGFQKDQYARVVVDSCAKKYTCESKHTQWQPSSAAGFLGLQNEGNTAAHWCLNNVGSWDPPDGEGKAWTVVWNVAQASCADSGINSQWQYDKDKRSLKSPSGPREDGASCTATTCCLTAEPCVAPCVPLTSNWGWVFIIAACVSIVLYLGGFIGYSVKVKNLPPALPHKEHWLNLQALVLDGVTFTAAQTKNAIAKYHNLPTDEGSLLRAGDKVDNATAEPELAAAPAAQKGPAFKVKTLAKHVENHPSFGRAVGGTDSGDDEDLVE